MDDGEKGRQGHSSATEALTQLTVHIALYVAEALALAKDEAAAESLVPSAHRTAHVCL